MSYLVIPAVISLLIKAALVIYNKSSLSKNYFTAILVVCLLHSCCEVAAFYSFFQGKDIDLLFRTYYVLTIWWLTFSFIHSKYVAGIKKFNYVFLLFATILSGLLLFTDILLSGYIEKGYSITAIKEEYYSLLLIFLLLNIFGAIFVLSWKLFFKQNSIQKETQCFYLLISFITPFTVAIAIIVSVYFNWGLSAIGILPIANLLFFLFIIKSENFHHITDIKRYLPWSIENKLSKTGNEIIIKCARGEISLKEATEEFQRILIEYQKKKGYSKLASAKKLGLSKSTLYSKLDKLKIEWKA